MMPRQVTNRWSALEAQAHLPEVQGIIKREIIRGTIRVCPTTNDRIRIVPTGEDAAPAMPLTAPGADLSSVVRATGSKAHPCSEKPERSRSR
jgi:hypothetical protein